MSTFPTSKKAEGQKRACAATILFLCIFISNRDYSRSALGEEIYAPRPQVCCRRKAVCISKRKGLSLLRRRGRAPGDSRVSHACDRLELGLGNPRPGFGSSTSLFILQRIFYSFTSWGVSAEFSAVTHTGDALTDLRRRDDKRERE